MTPSAREMKDPYYGKILEALEGPLDPREFEACVVDLLREAYGTLVPIPGGQDAGMDGAIADGEDEAYPLVTTTAKDVSRNLRNSLDSYLHEGGKRRRVVLATSTSLTPRRRRNLEQRAAEKGFTLVQIHAREDLAGRLYRRSQWAEELLGVTGAPSALSSIPETRRPLREDLDLVGRERDSSWLIETSGDKLIVGQPGSGKTYLLLHLAKRQRAFFLATDDDREIANACRDLEPQTVMVDDAHVAAQRLVRLRRIREEIGADFQILATTWPGEKESVAEALALGSSQNRELELLTRKQILEILRQLGVREPEDDPYLRALVDQCANRPGLAVTLGSLWLRGEWREILSGDAVRTTLLPTLKRILEHDPTELLGCFALGGDRGMELGEVASFLGVSFEEVIQRVTRASRGGVLRVLDRSRLSVQPEVLRSALLKAVFFEAPVLPYRDLMGKAPSMEDAVETLVRAALRGVDIPREELRDLVREQDSPEAWAGLARLDRSHGEWVLENFPGELHEISQGTLETAPESTIRCLLEASGPRPERLHSKPKHPLRILQSWLQEIPFLPGRTDAMNVEETTRRRRAVVRVAKEIRAGTEDEVLLHNSLRACFLAMSPKLQSVREAATGGTISIRQGLLPDSSLGAMLELWGQVSAEIDRLPEELWEDFERMIREWVYPDTLGGEDPDQAADRLLVVTHRILSDMKTKANGGPGLHRGLEKWAARAELDLDLDLDASFQTLFPLQDHHTAENWKEVEAKELEAARAMAGKWASKPPGQALETLTHYLDEAEVYCGRDLRVARAFFDALSERVEKPEEWLKEGIGLSLPIESVGPLLERLVRERNPASEIFLRQCLETEQYGWLAASEIIRAEGLSEDLLREGLASVPPHLTKGACLRGDVPASTSRLLLRHERGQVALAAAIGEWLADPRGEVRPGVVREWRDAIVRPGSGEEIDWEQDQSTSLWLNEIFQQDSELGFDWLCERVKERRRYLSISDSGVYAAAARHLNAEQRRMLLGELDPGSFAGRLISVLVDQNPEVYRALLDTHHLQDYHLDPLGGASSEEWALLAEIALDAGHTPEEVAKAAFWGPRSYSGFGVQYWSEWQEGFQEIADRSEGPLRIAATRVVELAQGQIDEAAERKRRFELTGRF